MAFSIRLQPKEWLSLGLYVAGVGASCLTIPLGSLTVIKAWLHTSAEQGRTMTGEKEGILQAKSFSLTQYGGAEVLAYCMGLYLTPISHHHGSSTLPSPSSWEFSTSVGHSTFSHPPHFPFYVHNFQFLNNRCSCSFPPPPTSLPPSSMNALFIQT